MVQGNLASQDTVDRITSYSKLDLDSVMACVLIFIDQ